MKKLLAVMAAVLMSASLFAYEWVAFGDANDGGSSTAELSIADETIAKKDYKDVITVKGVVTKKFQYGYAEAMLQDDEFISTLRESKGIRITVSGDGKQYDLRVPTPEVKDYGYYRYTMTCPKNSVKTYEIKWSDLKQYEWAAKAAFNPASIEKISIQTIDQPEKYMFKIVAISIIE